MRPLLSETSRAILVPIILLAACSSGGDGTSDDAGADVPGDAEETSGDAEADTLDAADALPGDAADTDVSPGPDLEPIGSPACFAEGPAPLERPESVVGPTLPWLRVEGRAVVDEDGTEVALRGVNFGSWMMMESWMAGVGPLEGELLDELSRRAADAGIGGLLTAARNANGFDWTVELRAHRVLVREWKIHMFENATAEQLPAVTDLWEWFEAQPWVFEEASLWEWLEGRFGTDGADRLRDAWQDSFVQEFDVERFAELGLNAIRVPVWYGNLERETPDGPEWREAGWQRLHRIAEWAREHGVYLIVDLHGAPGGQTPNWHTGLYNGGELWERDDCRAHAARIWTALATWFADDPHVAVYDLLNEPRNAPSAARWGEVHDELYQAIRAVDDRHIVMSEDGYRGDGGIRSPAELGWDNAMFSIHLYPNAGTVEGYATNIEDAIVDWGGAWERFDCPLYLGEFSPFSVAEDVDGETTNQVAALNLTLAMLNARGVHWGIWSWKYFEYDELWGLYVQPNPGERVNLRDASIEEIEAAFQALATENYDAIAEYADVLRARAADPVAPLDVAAAGE